MFGLIVLHQFISNQLIANDKKFYFLHTELFAFKIFDLPTFGLKMSHSLGFQRESGSQTPDESK